MSDENKQNEDRAAEIERSGSAGGEAFAKALEHAADTVRAAQPEMGLD